MCVIGSALRMVFLGISGRFFSLDKSRPTRPKVPVGTSQIGQKNDQTSQLEIMSNFFELGRPESIQKKCGAPQFKSYLREVHLVALDRL